MKNLLITLLILLLISCTFNRDKEYYYRGIVISKGYEEPTSGYKSSSPSTYYIMMREDKSGKIIRINVNVPTWYSLTVNDRTGFVLSNSALYRYGNTSDVTKNLYEQ